MERQQFGNWKDIVRFLSSMLDAENPIELLSPWMEMEGVDFLLEALSTKVDPKEKLSSYVVWKLYLDVLLLYPWKDQDAVYVKMIRWVYYFYDSMAN